MLEFTSLEFFFSYVVELNRTYTCISLEVSFKKTIDKMSPLTDVSDLFSFRLEKTLQPQDVFTQVIDFFVLTYKLLYT